MLWIFCDYSVIVVRYCIFILGVLFSCFMFCGLGMSWFLAMLAVMMSILACISYKDRYMKGLMLAKMGCDVDVYDGVILPSYCIGIVMMYMMIYTILHLELIEIDGVHVDIYVGRNRRIGPSDWLGEDDLLLLGSLSSGFLKDNRWFMGDVDVVVNVGFFRMLWILYYAFIQTNIR